MQKVLSTREKTIFFLTAGTIILGLIFNFAIAPILTKNDNLSKQINVAQEKLKKYLQLVAQKDYIQEKYSKFSLGPEASSGQEGDILTTALSRIEGLAQKANIKIIDIRPSGILGRAGKEIPIDLRTEGTVEEYLSFIYNLENSLFLLKIKEFQLNAKPNSRALEGIFSIAQLSAE